MTASESHLEAAWAGSEAFRAGVVRAEREMALQPPDDGLVTVSTAGYPDRAHFTLCRGCGQTRGNEELPDRCTCT